MRRLLFAFAFISLHVFLFPSSSSAQIYSVDIREIDPDSPIVGTIHVLSFDQSSSRTRVDLRIDAPDFFDQIDAIGQSYGNLGSSRNRLYWVGPTRFLSSGENGSFLVTTKARYESWTYIEVLFDTIKTKNFQDTKTIDVWVAPFVEIESRRIGLHWEIANIQNFPGELEQMLQKLGVSFDGVAQFEIADIQTAADVDLVVESLSASSWPQGAGISMGVRVSFDTSAAMLKGIDQFISPSILGSAGSLMRRLFQLP